MTAYPQNLLCAALVAAALRSAVPATPTACCRLRRARFPTAARPSQQEMITAMQTLKQYNGDVNVYLKCLEFEQKQNHLSASDPTRNTTRPSPPWRRSPRSSTSRSPFKAKHG